MLTDIIVIALVAAALFFCIRTIVRRKKSGASSCGCGCGCAGCGGGCLACGAESEKPKS